MLIIGALIIAIAFCALLRRRSVRRVRPQREYESLVETMVDALSWKSPFSQSDWRTRAAAEVFVVLCSAAQARDENGDAWLPLSGRGVINGMARALQLLRSPVAQQTFMASYLPLLAVAERFDRLGEAQQRLVAVPIVRFAVEHAYGSLRAAG
jgi:hypothetical protein